MEKTCRKPRYEKFLRRESWSMIPKKPTPDLIRGGNRFSEKIMLQENW